MTLSIQVDINFIIMKFKLLYFEQFETCTKQLQVNGVYSLRNDNAVSRWGTKVRIREANILVELEKMMVRTTI